MLEGKNYKIELLEECPCENIIELRACERKHIMQFKESGRNLVNKNIPNRTIKEYYQDNKERLVQKQREYDSVNRERILKRMKEYYISFKKGERNKKVVVE